MWRVCTPQYKKVYMVNRTTGSLVQDIFTNTIEHFEVCATRFIEKTIYIPHIGVENITITVHSYSQLMGVNYIANTGSVVQDIFTNTIEHFEVCATRFIEKTIYIPHIGVENITITVHSYSQLMGVNYIANTGSVVQDIFTNTIEHFEVCATRFIEKKNNIYTTYGSSKHDHYRSLLFTTYGSSLHSKYSSI